MAGPQPDVQAIATNILNLANIPAIQQGNQIVNMLNTMSAQLTTLTTR